MMKPGFAHTLKKNIRGRVKIAEPLARHTSFKLGGPAAIWCEPRDTRDLKAALACITRAKIPFFVVGGGTNILARDAGFDGVIIHLGSPFFKKIRIAQRTITVGAGFPLPGLVRRACAAGLSGLESLVGIPGTVGGALAMNAGGWTNPIFKNIGDYTHRVRVMDHDGTVRSLRRSELTFGYRQSNMRGSIILGATIVLDKENVRELQARCAKFLHMKQEKQVLNMPSAGCVFKNPSDFQFTSGQMIDMLGLKGRRVGGAEVSAKHANFIINARRAHAQDVLKLVELIQKKVKTNYHIPLELELTVI